MITNEIQIDVLEDYELTEEELETMSAERLLSYAGDALRGFVDERWQDTNGSTWQLMVLNEINNREGIE
jgi:hypothetical protein